jgi:hypothetical protein
VNYVFPLLIYIIFFDLHVQPTPYNQGLPFNRICNLLIMRKLDRVLMNEKWNLTFPLSKARFLPSDMSSKKEGGLGIKRITEWNKIALLKHIWNLCNDSDGSIWSPWIRSNLLRGRNFWTIKALENCSWAWGKILKLRSLAWPKMQYIIGDDMTTSLWFDNWHPHNPLANSYSERFIYDSGMGNNARVNMLISNSEWKIPTTQSIG